MNVEKAQGKIDFLEGTNAFSDNALAWFVLIFGAIFAVVLTLAFCFICAKDRVSLNIFNFQELYETMDGEAMKNTAMYLDQESHDIY